MPVYFISEDFDGPVKIGFSKDFKKRQKQFQTANHRPLMLMGYLENSSGNDNKDSDLEKEIHEEYRDRRIRGEWFNLSSGEVLSTIKAIHFDKNGYDGFLAVSGNSLKILGCDRDGILEIGGAWDWDELAWEECCPLCGCLCGLVFQEDLYIHECLKCGYASNSDLGNQEEENF